MNLPVLKIKDLEPRFPIIQGGMAIRISTGRLAGAVAKAGGIGLIAASGMGKDELKEEIKIAREVAGKDGIVGINIMVAASAFESITEYAMECGIDLVVAGAGFSRRLFAIGKKFNTPVVPIVSSLKAAKISQRLGASAIVVEGYEAGGHLGTDKLTVDLLKDIVSNISIPVIGAGGVGDQQDFINILKTGVSGVQIATLFALTEESNAHKNWKEYIINSNEKDMVIMESPVGFPGRAVNNEFLDRVDANPEEVIPKNCVGCLKHCSKRFCIIQALENARLGKLEDALIFAGKYFYKIKKILSVQEVFDMLLLNIEKL